MEQCQLPVANKKHIDTRGLAFMMDQINRSVFSASFYEGLNPAQWAALRFLGHASSSKRTVLGFADFQSSTAGTASRTLAALEKKGYARKVRSLHDHRSFQINLTPEGEQILAKDPLKLLEQALGSLSVKQLDNFAESLEVVIRLLKTQEPKAES